MTKDGDNILTVDGLKTYFSTEDGVVKAVDGISFELKKGETLGIVGESGSGKSVTNLSIMRLIQEPQGKIAGGKVMFDGVDVLGLPMEEVRKLRGKRIAMIRPCCAYFFAIDGDRLAIIGALHEENRPIKIDVRMNWKEFPVLGRATFLRSRY